VAHFLVAQMVRDVDADALDAAFEQVRDAVEVDLRGMYTTRCPGCDGDAQIQYTSWTKQITCEACHEPADLLTSRVVMADFQYPGGGLVQCPRCEHPWRARKVNARVQCSRCKHRFVPNKRLAHARKYLCLCGHDGDILDAVADASVPPTH